MLNLSTIIDKFLHTYSILLLKGVLPMGTVSRRNFVKTAAAASAAFPLFTIAGTKASGRVLGANERVRLGQAGIHGQGTGHLGVYAELKDSVDVTYLIDPDSSLFASRTDFVESKGWTRPKCVQDIRTALDDPDLDAVSIATPNHWHSLITVWACQAGKDVYVEKPLSHNLFEGRKAVEAARKYNRVVQHGTQKRSSEGFARTIAAVHSGKYGKLRVAKGHCYKPRQSIGFKEPTQPPPELDFDLWLGPATKQRYHGNLVHYNWHWFWDFGNGDLGNQGVHEVDVARWGIKDGNLPTKVWSLGGRFAYNDQGQTPNTQLAVCEFGQVLLVFEVRNAGSGSRNHTNPFYTEEGMILDSMFYPKNGGDPEPVSGIDYHVSPGGSFGNFINTVKSRNIHELNCDVLKGHYSAGVCHLANISYRLGEDVAFDKKGRLPGDNTTVLDTFESLREHLRGEVGLPLEGMSYRLGRVLQFDPQAERFVNDDEANALLTRQYRAPFVVPAVT